MDILQLEMSVNVLRKETEHAKRDSGNAENVRRGKSRHMVEETERERQLGGGEGGKVGAM